MGIIGFFPFFLNYLVITNSFFYLLYSGSKKKDFTGVYINCSSGQRLHNDCVAKTKVLETRKLMSQMVKIELKYVYLFHHVKCLADMIAIGCLFFFILYICIVHVQN